MVNAVQGPNPTLHQRATTLKNDGTYDAMQGEGLQAFQQAKREIRHALELPPEEQVGAIADQIELSIDRVKDLPGEFDFARMDGPLPILSFLSDLIERGKIAPAVAEILKGMQF